MGEHKTGLKCPRNASAEDWHYGSNTVRGLWGVGKVHAQWPKSREGGASDRDGQSEWQRSFFSCTEQNSVCFMFGWGAMLSRVTRGRYVDLMSLQGVLKLHTELARQTARYQHAWWAQQTRELLQDSCADPPTDRFSDWNFSLTSVCCLFYCCMFRSQGFLIFAQQVESPRGGPLRVCVCPSWRMSSVQMERGLFSCARARWVKSCRGSHTHTVTMSSFSHTHNKATMPGAGTGAKGSWFSHSESILDLSRGLRVSPCHSAESGWPLNSAVPIISSLTTIICIPQLWGFMEVFYPAKLCWLCCISEVTVGQEYVDFTILQRPLSENTI